MLRASNTITVPRPPAEVFAFLADGENDVHWRHGILDIRRVSGMGVGARYEQGVKGPMGRRVPADYEITAYEPDALIAFRATAGPVRPEGRYALEPVVGGTRVSFTLQAEPRGLARLLSPLVARSMYGEVQALNNLPTALPRDQ